MSSDYGNAMIIIQGYQFVSTTIYYWQQRHSLKAEEEMTIGEIYTREHSESSAVYYPNTRLFQLARQKVSFYSINGLNYSSKRRPYPGENFRWFSPSTLVNQIRY